MLSNRNRNKMTITERLILREIQTKDSESMHRYRNLPDVSRYQDWVPDSPQEVRELATEMARRNAFSVGEWYQIAILNRFNDTLVGDLAVCIEKDTEKQAELGIALDPSFQKQGIARESVDAICEYLFNEKKLHRIHVSIDPRNENSFNLFYKIGFRKEGLMLENHFSKNQWCDTLVMAILKREWIAFDNLPGKSFSYDRIARSLQ